VLRLADRDGHAHVAFGLEGVPALMLVRPDGHLAFRGPVDWPGLLTKYCERVFGPIQLVN
jgi:3-(3-hydroxy-phenyl)propionate hydroxylase